ncbi:MAG: RNA recognition motif domain-containing protein [Anaerolineae bacterium]
MRIYVGNLSYESTADDLRELFGSHGEVAEATVITDRDSGRSRGFGFVEMPSENEALAAIEALNGQEHMGRSLRVNETQERRDRGSGGGGGGRGGRGRRGSRRGGDREDRW